VKKTLLAFALITALSGAVASGALARNATTAPGYNFTIHVTITDGGILLDRSLARRGWLAHFVIINKSHKPVRFNVGGLETKLIPPGKKGKLGAYLDDRGQFKYQVVGSDKFFGYFQVQ
jgi:hypothetical protein